MKLQYRMPRLVVCDRGSSLEALSENKYIMSDITCRGIGFVILPARHQFENPVERQIKEGKKILNSLRQHADKSIYHQPQTLLELQSKLLLIENVLSLKPTLIFVEDLKESIIFPLLEKEISKPNLGKD